MTNSSRLRLKLSLALGPLSGVSQAILDNQDIAAVYPRYLFTLHSMIRASVPLMEAAASRATELGTADPTAEDLVAYLRRHIPEESGHDEWLLEDIECLGFERKLFQQALPPLTVAELVGSQYYWIHHYHPTAILGYIAVMEGYPLAESRVDALQRRTGWPSAAFRTLRKHSHLDPHHIKDLERTLDGLPLTTEQYALVTLNAFETVRLATSALRESLEDRGPVFNSLARAT